MSETVIFSVRSGLVTTLGTALSPTPVTLGHPGSSLYSSHVWLGVARRGAPEGSQTIRSMRAAPHHRYEQASFDIHIRNVASTPATAESAVATIVGTIATTIHADLTLGGATDLQWALVSAVECDTAQSGSEVETIARMTIETMAIVGV